LPGGPQGLMPRTQLPAGAKPVIQQKDASFTDASSVD
jgi:hypothetical protein